MTADYPLTATDEELAEPAFDDAGKVHDWRNYIGERTRALWATFNVEQRRALALDADDRALREDWE